MGRIMSMSQLVMALALVASLLQGTAAEEYHVGDATGWIIPQSSDFYTNWSSTFTFEVGDKLVFNFTTGAHNVANVTKDIFDSCNTANTNVTYPNGPATVPLNTAGDHYFICTVGTHCNQGQKLSVTVVEDKDNPSPPPPTGTTSPPPPSSASPRGVAFAFVFMSLAIAFFCC